jgi:uncharacterized repeat protein (TIGR03803 family)
MSSISEYMTALASAAVLVSTLITSQSAQAQTFTTLHRFNGTDGAGPFAGLIQATNGDFYGTTYYGGPSNDGTVFRITPEGAVATLHSFEGEDGAFPITELIQATNGDFYGSTDEGGANGYGTIFKITPTGTLTTLYSFCSETDCTDGEYPSGLIQATNGDFYGTTSEGGKQQRDGTVFRITPSGTLTTLHSFNYTDGRYPDGLVQATNGDFYGITRVGGAYGAGSIFKITPGGTLTTLYSFNLTDGAYPNGGLIQSADGDFYGTTFKGGAYFWGTVFKITPSSSFTTLYSFFEGTDGRMPFAGLIQATDRDFYGTTWGGGVNDDGTVFKITSAGVLTTLHRFIGTQGDQPRAALIQATSGDFYGATQTGGPHGDGTVFSLSVGLAPFVETQTSSGRVGEAVKILGSDLTGASGVTFNGTAAIFTVVSAYEITTTVPTGATSGTVEVTTPGGLLESNKSFELLQ